MKVDIIDKFQITQFQKTMQCFVFIFSLLLFYKIYLKNLHIDKFNEIKCNKTNSIVSIEILI